MAEKALRVREKYQVVQTLKEQLECPVCFNTFNQPRTLSCLHTYCESCLQRLVEANASSAQVLSCPECRAEIQLPAIGVKGLPIDFKLKKIIDIITVEQCYNITRRKSSIFTFTDVMCPVHQGKPLDYFCTSCEVVVCIMCTIEKHRYHEEVKSVSEVLKQHAMELEKFVPQINKGIRDGELKLVGLKGDLSKLNDTLYNAISRVHIYFRNGHEILENRQTMIANEMKIPVDQGEKKSQDHIARVTQALDGVKKSKQILEVALHKKSDDIRLLGEDKQLLSQIDDGIQHLENEIFDSDLIDYSSSCPTPFVLENNFLDQFKKFSYNMESYPTCKRPLKHGSSLPVMMPPLILNSKPRSLNRNSSETIRFSSEIQEPVFVIGLYDEKTPYPRGVCCLTEDTFMVTDTQQHLFKIIESTGKCLATVGSMGRRDGQFYEPMGVILDRDKNLLVLDGKGTGRIQKFSMKGNFLSTFDIRKTNSPPYMEAPIDLVELANGDILVTDSAKSCVHNFNASGKYIGVLGNLMELKQPSGIAVSGTHLVIADMANHCLFILNDLVKIIRRVGKQGARPGELNIPYGVAIDSGGYIVVSESGNHRISVFAPCGEFIRCFGGKGCQRGRFLYPRQICFNHRAELVVCDEKNRRLQLFRDIK